ncbi:DUF6268 family outer membrane beta-barrel protein [Aquirufa sp. OSTEICH-129A]
MNIIRILVFFLCPILIYAQTDTTDTFDYNNFGDADGVKRYCTVKVLNQTPQRIFHIGFENYGHFPMPGVRFNAADLPSTIHVDQVNAIRAQVNIPVLSTNKIIWQMGFNYWASNFKVANPNINSFANSLNNNTLVTAGINTTVFKPLNEKNFMIFQASYDVNGLFNGTKDISSQAFTTSLTLIYGWKTSEKNMIGTGLARTYRAGQPIFAPALFWNKTFNEKWGMELLLPARAHVRYNISVSNILQAGFEVEGNQYWANVPGIENVYLQRGEIKPRISWDKKLFGFLWLNLQAGLRYNFRFDVANAYNAKEESQKYFTSNLGNPLFFNVSLNFVSP